MDNSADAQRAADRVIGIASEQNSKVVMFHSLEHHFFEGMQPMIVPMSAGTGMQTIITSRQIKTAKIQKAEKLLADTKEKFKGTIVPVETRVIEDEKPEDYIIRIAEEENFDLVALGCKGEHSILRKAFRTVATKVLNDAPCDVLVVR